ncbi:Mastin [Plecturocebus cupreus]
MCSCRRPRSTSGQRKVLERDAAAAPDRPLPGGSAPRNPGESTPPNAPAAQDPVPTLPRAQRQPVGESTVWLPVCPGALGSGKTPVRPPHGPPLPPQSPARAAGKPGPERPTSLWDTPAPLQEEELEACAFRVQVGQLRLHKDDRRTSVAEILRHPQSNGSLSAQGGADMALLKLEARAAVPARPPVSLPPASLDVPSGKTCWVTRWGDIGHGGQEQGHLGGDMGGWRGVPVQAWAADDLR